MKNRGGNFRKGWALGKEEIRLLASSKLEAREEEPAEEVNRSERTRDLYVKAAFKQREDIWLKREWKIENGRWKLEIGD